MNAEIAREITAELQQAHYHLSNVEDILVGRDTHPLLTEQADPLAVHIASTVQNVGAQLKGIRDFLRVAGASNLLSDRHYAAIHRINKAVDGWAIFSTDRGLEIQRDDERDRFPSDAAAWCYVWSSALEGQSVASEALALIREWNPDHYAEIRKEVMPHA